MERKTGGGFAGPSRHGTRRPLKHLLHQRLVDNAVQFSLCPMRCFPRHAHSWSDAAMLTFSAQESTACAFTCRAQKMPMVTRRLGACALDRGDVNCSVRLKIFCARGCCSSILKPRAENVSNHAQPWHADACSLCTCLWSTCVCVRAPQKSPCCFVHPLLFLRTWCQESCWFDCSCGAHIFSSVSEIVELASISLAMCVVASAHSWADSSTCYSTTFTAHTVLHTRIFWIEVSTDVDVDLEVDGTCACEIPVVVDVVVVVVMSVKVVIVVRIIVAVPGLEVDVRRGIGCACLGRCGFRCEGRC